MTTAVLSPTAALIKSRPSDVADLPALLDAYLEILHGTNERLERNGSRGYDFAIEPGGTKYVRIVQASRYGGGGSVHAFVERATGKVIKAAGYKAPQKDKAGLAYRYDLTLEQDRVWLTYAADPFGSYLYKI